MSYFIGERSGIADNGLIDVECVVGNRENAVDWSSEGTSNAEDDCLVWPKW
ncbi:hypothetical protein ID866_2433 [Astraeus odoratus]|nr:hypothetical protein ID866_2433 [Astraeus odoratus]